MFSVSSYPLEELRNMDFGNVVWRLTWMDLKNRRDERVHHYME